MRSRVLATSSVAALSLILAGGYGSQAFAQDDENAAEERIVVTGSRIVRQDFVANSPIVTVSSDDFENTSSLTVESVLVRLPQFSQDARSEFRTTSVEPTTDQTPGTAQVNLRGLGSNRSLVLIDGRRAMPVNGAMAVDVNAIPSSAIERVEVISGGASAVYGADAVGGVVNFILKDNFEGAEFSARYGITEVGDGASTQLSGLFGADVAGGRGNLMFGADFSTRGAARLFERDWGLEQANNPGVFGLPNFASSARPQETGYNPTSRGGARPSQAAINSVFPGVAPGAVVRATPFFLLNDDGTVFTSNLNSATETPGAYKFNNDTTSTVQPGCPEYTTKYDGTIMDVVCFAEIATPLDRYSLFGRGKYEVNDALTISARGNYTSAYTRSQLIYGAGDIIVPHGDEIWTGNAYSASSLLGDGVTTNPEYRAGGRYGLNCGPTGGCTESEVFPVSSELATLLDSRTRTVANDAANDSFVLNIPLTWGDPRGSSTQTDTFQVELGAEGHLGALFEFANDWFWDASVAHGETHQIYQFTGFGSLGRFRAVAGSPNFGRGFSATGNQDFGGTSAGSATCTSGLPIIRDIDVSRDCIDAYEAIMQNTITIVQNTAEANLSGDLFELPAGPLQFAIGASYRDDNLDFNTDQVNDLNNFFDQPLGLFPKTNADGYISVRELYGELLVPVIQDVPFIQDLALELGGRISDFDPSGQVETYKILADWSINDFLRVRGGYNRASRAPNLNELFASRATTVATGGFSTDFCSQSVTTATAYAANAAVNTSADPAAAAAHVVDVCQAIMARDAVAAGLPANTGADVYYGRPAALQDSTSAGTTVVRGNLGVEPETADTWTVGLVVTSPFPENPILSGLSGSVDWYQIEIADLIGIRSVDSLAGECFSQTLNSSADPNTFACQTIIRNPLDGEGLFIDRTYTNEGWARLSGVDLQVNWRGQFDDVGLPMIPGGAGVSLLATFPIEQLTQDSPVSPVIDSVGTAYTSLGIGAGSFDYTTLTTFNYFVGPVSTSLSWEYTPSIEDATCATNPACTRIGVPKGASLFSLNGSYRLNDTVTFRAGVDNLLDTEPPRTGGFTATLRPQADLTRTIGGFGGSGQGAGAYDPLGRRYFMGVTLSY